MAKHLFYPTAPPAFASDVALRDWNDLLTAVKSRLRNTVGEFLSPASDLNAPATAERIRVNVLECVAALDQLHATLDHELSRRTQLELELVEVRSALERARAGLAGGPAAASVPMATDRLLSSASSPCRGFL